MPDPAPTSPKKRGPKTPEGKARSSMNALKHGLRSKRFLLLPEEDPEDFASFVSDIRAAYGPEDAVESAMSRRSRWRCGGRSGPTGSRPR